MPSARAKSQRALAAGYATARRPATDRLHGRHLRPRIARPGRRQGMHVNCGSPDMIDQLGERAPGRNSRCASTPASATATAARRTPAASNRSTASGTNSSTTACAGPIITALRSPACTCTSARAPTWSTCRRSAGRWKSWRCAAGRSHHDDQRRRRPAGSLSAGRIVRRRRCVLPAVGCDAQAARRARSAMPVHAGDRAGPLPGGRERLPGERNPRDQADGGQHVLSCSTPASTISPGRSCTAPIIRCRSCPARAAQAARAAAGRRGGRRPAVRVGRHLHADRRRLRRHAQLAGRRGGRAVGDRERRRLRRRDELELQLEAAGRRGADPRRGRTWCAGAKRSKTWSAAR